MDKDIPYMDFREVSELDEKQCLASLVHYDEETRIRVYKTQLQDTIVEHINLNNYLYQVSIYYKIGYRLLQKYPTRRRTIINATKVMWQRVQYKLKTMRKPKDAQHISSQKTEQNIEETDGMI